MSDDIDDLLGEGSALSARDARKKARRSVRASAQATTDDNTTLALVQALHRPVSITFLADVMGMDRTTVRKRLANLPPLGQKRGGNPLYDFRQAMQYLVTPRVDMEKVLASMSAGDLPPSLQKDVWDARLKAQKWMVQAGELWATDDVLEVLGEAFQRLKTTTQLWIDQIGDTHSLPVAARKELTELVDTLQANLHKTLVEMPKEKATLSQAATVEAADDE